MALAGIVIALLAASDVSVSVAPGAPCVDRASLVLRLQSAGLRVVAGESSRLAVSIRLAGDGLIVRAAAFERRVPARPGECGAVERVVVALITSWSLQLPSVELGEPKRVSVPVVTAAAEDPPEASALSPTLSPAGPAGGGSETPPPAAPPPERKPLPSPSGPATALEVDAGNKAELRAGPSIALDLGALGGGSFWPSASTAVGQLHVGLGSGHWGALLEGGFQSARVGESGSIRVESTTQWLSLSGRFRFQPETRLRLDVALGFRVWRIAAESFNTVNPTPVELAVVGGVLSVGGSYRLAGPVALHLRAFASLRTTRSRFLVDGLGPLLDLQPWEAGLLLGLEFHVLGG